MRGAHTLGFNYNSVGIAVIGNFEQTRPRVAVIGAVARVAAWQLDRFKRRPAATTRVRSQGSDRFKPGRVVRLPVIDGHRDTNQTACPGGLLYDRLPAIRRRAQARVNRF